jgi:putative redox protein
MAQNFKGIVQQMQAALTEDDSRGQIQFTVNTRQISGLRSEAVSRQFTQVIDEPESIGGTDLGPSPVEVALASLGSCHEITYRMCADELGVPLDGVSVTLVGNIDFQGFFGVSEGVRPGFGDVDVMVTLDTSASQSEQERLKQVVERRCPVLDLFRNPTPVATSLSAADATEAAQ